MENQKVNLNTKEKGTKFSPIQRNAIITSLVLLYVFEKESFIRLPKLGLVKFAKSKDVKGRILSATVRRTPSGKVFCISTD